MSLDKYKHYVEGCLELNDKISTVYWLKKAYEDSSRADFENTIVELMDWLQARQSRHRFADTFFEALYQVEPEGDAQRRSNYASHLAQQERAQIERAQKIERQKNEEQRLAKAEKERLLKRERRSKEYLARREEEEAMRKARDEAKRKADAELEYKRQESIRGLTSCFNNNFLNADHYYKMHHQNEISPADYEQVKIEFVKTWISNNMPSGRNGEKYVPDDEQAAAIAAVNGNIQVVARAGSGKTSTLVNRAFFLIKHCGVRGEEMLLLAFNTKAVGEIEERLGKLLGTRETLPYVMTFHALGHALVQPQEEIIKEEELYREVQRLIDDHLQIPEWHNRIREVMESHFKADWAKILKGKFNVPPEEMLKFHRALPHETLNGDRVKSYGEKLIGDFLFEYDIAYKYEKYFKWGKTAYRPDFAILKTGSMARGIVIEYFGLDGEPDYDEMSNEKRAYWKDKADWDLIELTPQEIDFSDRMRVFQYFKSKLEEHGVFCEKLPEDEIWKRIRDRAIDDFTKAMSSFVTRCRQQCVSPEDLSDLILIKSRELTDEEKLFCQLAKDLFVVYLDTLKNAGFEDFAGILQRAVQNLNHGEKHFHRKNLTGDLSLIKYLFIDEFQDFNELFYRLVVGIQKQNPKMEIFCVGDNWQAINGFAGADLKFFDDVNNYLGGFRKLYIKTNYRSFGHIVMVANAVMKGRGKPATPHTNQKGQVLKVELDSFECSSQEMIEHGREKMTPVILRLVRKSLERGLQVVMLSRTKKAPARIKSELQSPTLEKYCDHIRSYFPEELRGKITISTAHKYKGREKETVIVLDVKERRYPLLHPLWVFTQILGNSLSKIINEERRLLYVALTRAVSNLVIITEKSSPSPFLVEMEAHYDLSPINWKEYPAFNHLESNYLKVKVKNPENSSWPAPTVEIKEGLKAYGFQYVSAETAWVNSYSLEKISGNIKILEEKLQRQPWSDQASGVEVEFLRDDKVVACYYVNKGDWKCIRNDMAALESRT